MEQIPHPHVNPPSDRMATAPYNFVPLPQRVLLAERVVTGEPWKAHHRWLPGMHSGWIDLEITTLTPLFIRGPVSRRGEGWDQRETRQRPDPWMTPDGRPTIPGSSLRGMLRALVEILAFAKITPVSDAKPFFRNVSDDRIGIAYRNRVLQGGKTNPEGGFLRRHEDRWVITPAKVLRVLHQDLQPHGFRYADPPRYYPDWNLQHRSCWVQHNGERVTEFRLQTGQPPGDGWAEGTLVLTGGAPPRKKQGEKEPGKKAEFLFLDDPTAKLVDVPDEVWERFHDDDQISQWQEKAFPRDKPNGVRRRAAGHLRDGEPVFFLRQGKDEALFLGRAQMFRFPYDRGMAGLVPEPLRLAGLDLAEVMFGRICRDREDQLPTVKGRVFVEDAVAVSCKNGWFELALVPQILSSPNPTTFPHYLTQNGQQPKTALTTYLTGDRTTIRGHKLYWHRWGESGLADVRDLSQNAQRPSSQHTVIRPAQAGVTFRGRMRFDNLNDVELGALLAALRLPDGCAHKLGMAKPLGLGSVQITPTLHRIDREARYRSWSDTGERPDEDAALETRCLCAFEKAVAEHAEDTGEAIVAGKEGLHRFARLDALFTMLTWKDRPPREATTYLLLNEFRDKKVLPTPHRVTGQDEPKWPGDAPTPAPKEPDSDQPPSSATGVGSLVHGIALETKTKKGGWVFALPDDREGILHPLSPEPPGLKPGQQHDFILKTDPAPGDRAQLQWVDPDNPQPLPGAKPKKDRGENRRKPKRGRR